MNVLDRSSKKFSISCIPIHVWKENFSGLVTCHTVASRICPRPVKWLSETQR